MKLQHHQQQNQKQSKHLFEVDERVASTQVLDASARADLVQLQRRKRRVSVHYAVHATLLQFTCMVRLTAQQQWVENCLASTCTSHSRQSRSRSAPVMPCAACCTTSAACSTVMRWPVDGAIGSEATELAWGDGAAAGPAVLVLLLRDRCGRPAGTKPSRSTSSGAYSRATPEALDAHDSTTWHTRGQGG